MGKQRPVGWGPLGRGGRQNSLWVELQTAGAQPAHAHPGTGWPGRAFEGKARVCVSNRLGGGGRHRSPWVQGCSQWSRRDQRAESHIQGGSCPVCATRSRCQRLSLPRKPPQRPALPLTTEASVWKPMGRARSMCQASSPLLLVPPSGLSRARAQRQAQPARAPGLQSSQALAPPGWLSGQVQLSPPPWGLLGPPPPALPATSPGLSWAGRRTGVLGQGRFLQPPASPTLLASFGSGAGCQRPDFTKKKKKKKRGGCLRAPTPISPTQVESWCPGHGWAGRGPGHSFAPLKGAVNRRRGPGPFVAAFERAQRSC